MSADVFACVVCGVEVPGRPYTQPSCDLPGREVRRLYRLIGSLRSRDDVEPEVLLTLAAWPSAKVVEALLAAGSSYNVTTTFDEDELTHQLRMVLA